LRRVHARVLKLHMRLPAMMHLVLEEMRQEVADRLGDRPVAAARFDPAVQIVLRQRKAELQQPRVGGRPAPRPASVAASWMSSRS
jgi:hypothetical protein